MIIIGNETNGGENSSLVFSCSWVNDATGEISLDRMTFRPRV